MSSIFDDDCLDDGFSGDPADNVTSRRRRVQRIRRSGQVPIAGGADDALLATTTASEVGRIDTASPSGNGCLRLLRSVAVASSSGDVRARRIAWTVVWFFVVSLIVFSVLRVLTDVPNLSDADALPIDDFNTRYARHPVVAYLHIIPGVLYIVVAPFQVSKRIRRSNIGRHRRLGRVAATAGLLSALVGVIFGVLFPWGGTAETTASLLFGVYMTYALIEGVRAARRHDQHRHRRWMLRAFAVALGVATIRVVLGLGEAFNILVFDDAFGLAFWIGFLINAIAVELWLRRWPTPAIQPASTRMAT